LKSGAGFPTGSKWEIVRNATGLHTSQGTSGYITSLSPDILYLEADFGTAGAQVSYRSSMITIEFYNE